MAFQSDLAGAAVTLMGAVLLSTPEMMQMHEMHVLRVLSGQAGQPFYAELLQAAAAASRNICLYDKNKQ
ncbi:hypothetical protein [Synechococcus sp. MIT S9504]|uniref:hypothetical protein n=1 Tax=Synechococcus sp. MIT S9504 TaxID=1801628 RepID=UPI0007BB3CEB|nr:hypothetical protein [Synechococcus sp. MIT S9504]KZR85236.1 hypothetical protein MITS9504_02142 [Synechococcus sp. MIT S9504]